METTKLIEVKIRQFRKLRNITQEQLAEASDSTGSYIGKLERGEVNVQIRTLEKIAEALGTNTFAFLTLIRMKNSKVNPGYGDVFISFLSRVKRSKIKLIAY